MTDIIAMIAESQAGEVALDINRKLQEVVQAICETQGKGVLNLKITMQPGKLTGKGPRATQVQTIVADFDCSIKKPELGMGDAIFFVDENGELTRDDPRQERMFDEKEMKRV